MTPKSCVISCRVLAGQRRRAPARAFLPRSCRVSGDYRPPPLVIDLLGRYVAAAEQKAPVCARPPEPPARLVAARELVMQHSPRDPPVALNRNWGDAEDLGDLLFGQTAEEAQLHDAALSRVELGQLF